MVVLKCKFGPDTRRIRVEQLPYEQLIHEILPKMFNEDISKYHVTYTDPEGDTVFITNELELKEALVLCPDMLVLTLLAKNAPQKTENGTEEQDSGDASPKRKVNGMEEDGADFKKLRTATGPSSLRANYNYTPVRVMVIDALRSLTFGGTIHDIMDYVNENFPAEAKNIKDLHKAIQGRLSSRKEFVKANFKKLDKLTKKECTVWTLSNSAGTKKVTRPHKGKRQETRVKYDDGPAWEDEEDEDDEDSNDTEDEIANGSKKIDVHESVVEALRALGGRGTIQDIREWLMDHYPDYSSSNYKLHRILYGSDKVEEENTLQGGMKTFRLVDGQPDPADLNEHRDLLMLSDLSNDLANSAGLTEGTVPSNPISSSA